MDPWEWGLCGQSLGSSMLSPSLTASPPVVGNTSAPPCSPLQITLACFTDSCVGALQWGLHFNNHSGGSAARLSYFSWTAESQRFLDPWCCPGRCWKVEGPTHLPTRRPQTLTFQSSCSHEQSNANRKATPLQGQPRFIWDAHSPRVFAIRHRLNFYYRCSTSSHRQAYEWVYPQCTFSRGSCCFSATVIATGKAPGILEITYCASITASNFCPDA